MHCHVSLRITATLAILMLLLGSCALQPAAPVAQAPVVTVVPVQSTATVALPTPIPPTATSVTPTATAILPTASPVPATPTLPSPTTTATDSATTASTEGGAVSDVVRIVGHIKQGDFKDTARPIKNITLTLSSKETELEAKSDDEGYFEFDPVPAAEGVISVDVRVTGSGMVCRFIDVLVNVTKNGNVVTHDVLLPDTLYGQGEIGMTNTGMIYRCVR